MGRDTSGHIEPLVLLGSGIPLGAFVQAAKHVREAVAEATWQAFWLSTIENQPTADVARQLGVRQGMVYLSRCRVLDRIRKLLKQWESEE